MIIGQSAALLAMQRLVRKMAQCDAPVLIEGETGTGKELAARAIHYQSARRDFPFIPVNCGAIPDSLIENELFGHRRGAYTDAKDDQPGLVVNARRGTLFLDELEALSLKGQVTLLRFLQDLHFRPLGASESSVSDVRIIAASNADLGELVAAGRFRSDLLFRLRILYLRVPRLVERLGDAPLLAAHFLERIGERSGQGRKRLDPRSDDYLNAYDWPGNIRELENLVYSEYFLSDAETLLLMPGQSNVRPILNSDDAWYDFRHAKERAIVSFERNYLARLMNEASGNVSHAARMAGKERRALGRLLKKHGFNRIDFQ